MQVVDIPMAALALAGTARLPEGRPVPGRPRLDPVGTLLLGGAPCGVMTGLMFGPVWGWASPGVIGLIAGGTVLLAAFAVAEARRRASHRPGDAPRQPRARLRQPGWSS